MAAQPEVVLFDVGNTLLFPNWQRILQPLAERSVVPSDEQLRETESATKLAFDQLANGSGIDRDFWRMFYSRLLQTLVIADEQLVIRLTAATRTSANWDRALPGTREALDRIANKFRIGVISNADGKIDQVLKMCGLGDCFASITDSGTAGYEKPHSEIFAAALRSMKVSPERALYVGDLYSVDYVGATGAGMQAVLFDVAGAYQETSWPRVASLKELEQRLAAEVQ